MTAAVTLTAQRPLSDTTLTCLPLAAASLLLFGVVVVSRDRKRLFGYRLALGGLYLSALPFIALLVAALKSWIVGRRCRQSSISRQPSAMR